jgi:hypothetical protein
MKETNLFNQMFFDEQLSIFYPCKIFIWLFNNEDFNNDIFNDLFEIHRIIL